MSDDRVPVGVADVVVHRVVHGTSDSTHVIVHAMNSRPNEIPQVITMPRSVQDIIDSASDLARRFEDLHPREPGSPALAAIHRAVMARAQSEADLLDAVAAARGEGRSWAEIGTYLGIGGEAARQK